VGVLLLERVARRAVPDLPFNRSFSFAIAHRLLRKNGFNHVIHAENILDKYFKVFFIFNRESNARLGIVAPKKILPSAVDRNRVKRIIRETFRQHKVKFNGLDLVVMVKCVQPLESGVLYRSLEKLFSRIESRCAKQ